MTGLEVRAVWPGGSRAGEATKPDQILVGWLVLDGLASAELVVCLPAPPHPLQLRSRHSLTAPITIV
jgi:hypothetical protein